MTSPTPSSSSTAVGDPRAEVAHLLRRAGFGGRPEEIDAAATNGYEATVDTLLAGPGPGGDPGAAATPPPDLGPEPTAVGRDPAARKAANQQRAQQELLLVAWWLDRMTRVTAPLVEKRTFFWHGHWATSEQKVRSPQLMLAQNQTLRALGGGDFGVLAHAMVHDPAMALWLDASGSTRRAPNENLGRELMELFTLGIGNYTENDVREAARALTGWRLDRTDGRLVFNPAAHDSGSKTVVGQSADFDAESLVDLLVGQPASHVHVVTRLWNRLAAPGAVPADAMGRLLAAYGPGRNLTALLRALLLDPVFRGATVRGALVKQPVEYVVGALRMLDIRVDTGPGRSRTTLLAALRALGQIPFEPPNVGGWPAGSAWLTTAAAQARLVFAQWAVSGADIRPVTSAPAAARVDAAARLLGVDAWTPRTRAALAQVQDDPRELVLLALVSPEYATN
ncbi:uncharacterized protein (DUF1800 family) [Streptacidiphilus sp. MAP12-16]|uniref:DUF1800 domain-containing protein n=1 Tax=Streptacidiphilus sp. MAP12-16 TaxID=3156300 RepID=UPI003513C4D6